MTRVVDPKKKKFINRLLGFFQTTENIYVITFFFCRQVLLR